MSESLICANFDISFSLFCRKCVQSWMRRFWAKKCRRDHLRSLWRSVVPVTVRRWQHREAVERRWGSLTKCGITKLLTVSHGYDGQSWLWRSVLQVRREDQRSDPSTQIPRVNETLDGPLCLWRSVTLAVEGNEESSRRIAPCMGRRSPRRFVMTTTVRRVVRRPSRVLADFQ